MRQDKNRVHQRSAKQTIKTKTTQRTKKLKEKQNAGKSDSEDDQAVAPIHIMPLEEEGGTVVKNARGRVVDFLDSTFGCSHASFCDTLDNSTGDRQNDMAPDFLYAEGAVVDPRTNKNFVQEVREITWKTVLALHDLPSEMGLGVPRQKSIVPRIIFYRIWTYSIWTYRGI